MRRVRVASVAGGYFSGNTSFFTYCITFCLRCCLGKLPSRRTGESEKENECVFSAIPLSRHVSHSKSALGMRIALLSTSWKRLWDKIDF